MGHVREAGIARSAFLKGTLTLAVCFALVPLSGETQGTVGLYGIFERATTNTKPYSNPFDYRVIELRMQFTSPLGKRYEFYGFYDGDGAGGQRGKIWRFRFMPNETGADGPVRALSPVSRTVVARPGRGTLYRMEASTWRIHSCAETSRHSGREGWGGWFLRRPS
jgi:hypothetical protein